MMWIKIENDRTDLLKYRKAHHILYENLQSYYYNRNFDTVVIDQASAAEFTMTFNRSETRPLYSKGCVSYQNNDKKTITICDEVK